MDENKYTSRKFLLTLIISLTGIVALAFTKLTGDQFNTLQLGVLAIYLTGNVAQKFTVDSKAQ